VVSLNKKFYVTVILLLIFTLFIGCGLDISKSKKPDIETKPEPESVDPIAEQLDKLTLDEKIGQMLMFGIDGYEISGNTKKLIDKDKIGGFIIMGDNVQSSTQLRKLMNSLKQQNSQNNIPLFLSVDEEGGRISRMPKEFKSLPTNEAIGKINNKEFSYNIGSIIAEQISAFGFNMDFAPVLDINSNPKNPVIGNRSFGSNAQVVSDLGVETMKGIQSRNVIPVIKHFPGHGDTSVDSHKGLPSVNNDLNRLESFEFIPFSKAIDEGAEVVMIAHILLKKIDEKNPSSMSKTIITDILRNKLKFQGVVITDDMTMGAIIKNYKIGEAAVKSVKAGSDIVLVCHGYNNEMEVISALKKAVGDGDISQERIDESVYRILKLKQKYNLKDKTVGPVDVKTINNSINELLNSY
jgi:beta-N-acetylhexosaminidase